MSILQLQGVSKTYGQGALATEVLDGINLRVDEGEFVAIVGFSGSGKTTLISLIAGLIAPTKGRVLFDGKPVTGAGPDRAVIFQNYSLLPWLSVLENVLLAVRAVHPSLGSAEQMAHARRYVDMVNLTPAAGKRPHELSGGMRQRVSVARALAMNPRLLLLDEPLGALDALTRAQLQKEIQRIITGEQRTAVLITNDVDEAILLADRIHPLDPGPKATLGPAFEVKLARPRNAAELNTDPEFKRIRNELTHYLTEARRSKRAGAQEAGQSSAALQPRTQLPNLTPIDLLSN